MTTTNLQLPILAAGQAQKHVTVNEALILLDDLAQISVVDRTSATPPASPAEGVRYLVPAAASGSWAGKSGLIAARHDGYWQFRAPKIGWIVYVEAESQTIVFTATGWQPVGLSETAAKFGVNATADATNRLAVKSPATLFDHVGSGHQLKVNKANSAATASLLFQDNYSGRAEIGLTGDSNLHVKTSPDGSTWRNAFEIDRTTGAIGINTAPTATERVKVKNDANALTLVTVDNQDVGAQASSGFSLTAANNNYFRLQLYASNYMYAITTSPFFVGTQSNSGLYFRTNGLDRIAVSGDGRVSMGSYAFSSKLYVDGAIRPKDFTVATLPSAATEGAGAMVFVSNETGGPTIAFSDGTNWRRVQDRAVVA